MATVEAPLQDEAVLNAALSIVEARHQQSTQAMSEATVANQITIKDVPFDDDLEPMFSAATTANFQALILMIQINRRLARLEKTDEVIATAPLAVRTVPKVSEE